MEALDEPPRTGNVDVMDLIPCLGLCCCFFSCYTEMPDCLGTVCESSCLCFNNRSLLCKTGKEEEIYCKCFSCECDVTSCNACCKSRSQICCLDLRASLPPTDQIPCMLNVLCCTCCYEYNTTCQCGKDIREISAAVNKDVSPIEKKWKQKTDPESKRVYFVNIETGKSQWEVPEDFEG